MVNDLLCVISTNFEGHEVTNGFTNSAPASMVFMTVQRERCIIHMVVYQLVESEAKEGADIIGCAECKLQRDSLDVVRER